MVIELGRSFVKMAIIYISHSTTKGSHYGAVGSCGHTWQTVSRSNNTWYQNTTNRPIQVAVGLFTNKHLRVGSATNNYVDVIHTGNDHSEAMNGAIVPNNHYYQTDGYRTWTELR